MVGRSYVLGIGAAKSGTTTLATLMSQHPKIQKSIKGKEVHFFDEKFDKGSNFYHDQWNLDFDGGICLDFTPSYLFDPACRDRVLNVLGSDVKFVAILRNPIDRAYSHYCHAVKHWHKPEFRPRGYPIEDLSFMDALLVEDTRLASGEFHIRHQSYFSKGLYSRQIKWYYKAFPIKNFRFIIFEKFISDHVSHLKALYEWLGVDSGFAENQKIIKKNSQTFGEIPLEAKDYLHEKYLPAICELEQLIDVELTTWK